MSLLLASAVGVPVSAIILFSILESIGETSGFWEKMNKVALDLCIVSIGIVGGIFVNVRLVDRMGTGGPINHLNLGREQVEEALKVMGPNQP